MFDNSQNANVLTSDFFAFRPFSSVPFGSGLPELRGSPFLIGAETRKDFSKNADNSHVECSSIHAQNVVKISVGVLGGYPVARAWLLEKLKNSFANCRLRDQNICRRNRA